MKKLTHWFTVGVCTLTLGAGLALAKDPVGQRQKRQQRRIGQGVNSGELAKRETLKLERNAARIHRSVVKDRHNGGVFTPRERAKAHSRLNKQSRTIYRQKHDGQTQNK